MKPIFYKSKESGDCFRLVIETNDSEQVDALLDQLNICVEQYISEDDFRASCEEFMDLDVFDTTNAFKIGTLTCRHIECLGDDDVIA